MTILKGKGFRLLLCLAMLTWLQPGTTRAAALVCAPGWEYCDDETPCCSDPYRCLNNLCVCASLGEVCDYENQCCPGLTCAWGGTQGLCQAWGNATK
jgi:hypothetical protein